MTTYNLNTPDCQEALNKTLHLLNQYPQYRALHTAAGNVKISFQPYKNFAPSDFKTRQILLDPSIFNRQIEDVYPSAIAAIFFETYNLSQNKSFQTLRQRSHNLTPNEFVTDCEKIQYNSALKTRDFILSIFSPQELEQITEINTQDHFFYFYLFQQINGYSQNIWKHYADSFPEASYHEIWSTPLLEEERAYISTYVNLKGKSLSKDHQIAKKYQNRLQHFLNRLYNYEKIGNDFFTKLLQRIDEIEVAADLYETGYELFKSTRGIPVPSYDEQNAALQNTLDLLTQTHEYQTLRESAGSLEIVIKPCKNRVFCNYDTGQIVLDPSLFDQNIDQTYPKVLAAIFFGVYNFTQKEKFQNLLQSAAELTPNEFIQNQLKLEYQSVLKAKEFLRDHYNPEYWLQIFESHGPDHFADYYLLQEITGYAQNIWERNAFLFPSDQSFYPLLKGPFSDEERDYLKIFINLKAMTKDTDLLISEKGKTALATLRNENPHISRLDALVEELEEPTVYY